MIKVDLIQTVDGIQTAMKRGLTATAGGASFLRSGSGEGLSELVIEFPAILRVFLKDNSQNLYFDRIFRPRKKVDTEYDWAKVPPNNGSDPTSPLES